MENNNGKKEDRNPDELFTQKIETFDFALLVARFDQARVTNSDLEDDWSLMDALLDAHLRGSDSEALGGDLSYQYGTVGGVSSLPFAVAQEVLKDARFGAANQAVQDWPRVNAMTGA